MRFRSSSAPSVEVTHHGGKQLTPHGVGIENPAFDVTPAKYVTAIITERGVLRAPYASRCRSGTAAVGMRLGYRRRYSPCSHAHRDTAAERQSAPGPARRHTAEEDAAVVEAPARAQAAAGFPGAQAARKTGTMSRSEACTLGKPAQTIARTHCRLPARFPARAIWLVY